MIDIIKRLFLGSPAPSRDAVVIDQASYFDSLKVRQQRWREDDEAEARGRLRAALMIAEWARDTNRKRMKIPLPTKLPRDAVLRAWLEGLWLQEIFLLSKSPDGYAIRDHIYGDERIGGVRVVQVLPESVLRFPMSKIADDDTGRAGSGGGPKKSK
jgi:hypothetical protein